MNSTTGLTAWAVMWRFMWRCFWAQCIPWKACFMSQDLSDAVWGGRPTLLCCAPLAKFPRLILLHQKKGNLSLIPILRLWSCGLEISWQTQATFSEYEHPLMFTDGLENWLVWQVLKPHVTWVGIQGDGAQYTPLLGSPEWPPYSSEAMEIFETLTHSWWLLLVMEKALKQWNLNTETTLQGLQRALLIPHLMLGQLSSSLMNKKLPL